MRTNFSDYGGLTEVAYLLPAFRTFALTKSPSGGSTRTPVGVHRKMRFGPKWGRMWSNASLCLTQCSL